MVDDDGPPPVDLQLAWYCEQWPGLVVDMTRQEFRAVHRMTVARNYYRCVSRLRGLRGDQIHSLSDNERRMIRYLREEKIL